MIDEDDTGAEPEQAAPVHSSMLGEDEGQPGEVSDTRPRFLVELLCETPVPVRSAEYHADGAAEAELLHRRANGLTGTIAGGVRVTPL